MARDRPSPYGGGGVFYRSAGACPPRMSGRPQHGERQALALRWEEGVLGDVARGPVPRERSVDRSMARDRPSPYGDGVAFFYRSAVACPRDVERFMKHPHIK